MSSKKAPAERPHDPSPLDPDLPPLAIEYRDAASLVPYAHNARTHDPGQIRTLQASMLEFGWTNPVLVDEQGIIAGHGRLVAAQGLWAAGHGIPRCPVGQVPTVTLAGLSPAQRRAYILADNQIATKAGWDFGILRTELADLKGMGFDLGVAGFEAADLAMVDASAPDDGDTIGQPPSAGDLLALVNITIDEPRHTVEPGGHFILGGRHHLLCCAVMDEWEQWAPLLKPGAIFAPYPGVFVVYGRKAEKHPLVLVQPDPYICGHILDRYEECYGEGAVQQVTATASSSVTAEAMA